MQRDIVEEKSLLETQDANDRILNAIIRWTVTNSALQ